MNKILSPAYRPTKLCLNLPRCYVERLRDEGKRKRICEIVREALELHWGLRSDSMNYSETTTPNNESELS